MTVPDILARAALVNCPPGLAGAEPLSYEKLGQSSAALGGALRGAGVQPGDLVAVCLPRSAQQVLALVAIRHAGAAYLPLDPQWPQARLAALLARSGATALVAQADVAMAFAGDVPVIAPDATGDAAPHQGRGPGHLAYVICTSGTTGEPNGVEVTDANLAGLALDAAAWEIWPVLASGGTLVIPADETIRYDATRLAAWLTEEAIEVAFAPTAIAEQLIAHA